jgi:hypothetical protein
MAHTGNTRPGDLREDIRHRRAWVTSDDLQRLRRLYNRRDRHDSCAELRRGREPAPVQPRGRAVWDAW